MLRINCRPLRFVFLMLSLGLLLISLPLGYAKADFNYASVPTPRMIVMDATDGTIFFERAADERAYPASTTKIMTCLLALEGGNLSDTITVGEEVLGTTTKFSKYSSLMGLQPGETVTLKDLVYGLMLVSGNDAAEAIAVHMAGSVPAFVDRMNAKAAALGLSNTHFANPHGVQSEQHYTTARDMARLTQAALQNPDFVDIAKTLTYTVPPSNLRTSAMQLANSNRLLKKPDTDAVSCVYPYAIGVKTGDTNAAGKCLVAAAEKDGARVIAVLFGDTAELYNQDTDRANLARFQHAAAIFDDLFGTAYRTIDGTALGLQTSFDIPVLGASTKSLPDGLLHVTVDVSDLQLHGTSAQLERIANNTSRVQTELHITGGELLAPVGNGMFLGTVDYILDGEILHSASLISPMEVLADSAMKGVHSDNAIEPISGSADTPLVKRPWLKIGFLGLLLIILVILLVALFVVYIASEKRRKRERARRRRAHYARQQSRYDARRRY